MKIVSLHSFLFKTSPVRHEAQNTQRWEINMPTQDALLAIHRPCEFVKIKALLLVLEQQTVINPLGA